MERLVCGGVVVLSLAILAWAAPQQHSIIRGGGDQLQQVSAGNGQTTGKLFVYKNNTREDPPGGGELFGYPENPSNIESKQNARNRTPVFIPNRCQENEILYPGDQEYDWVCDCKPTFIYHPPTKQCYQLYTQGYCNNGTMLILKKDAKQPECVTNSCYNKDVNMVLFKDECVKLNAYHSRCRHHDVKLVVSVREDTNELDCINISAVVGLLTHPVNGSIAEIPQQRGN